MKPRIHMLGRFNVTFGSQAEQAMLPRRKAAALLAILASPVGKERSRQELADLLWGQCGESASRNNLRQSLFVIRKYMPQFPGLLVTHGGIALDRSSVLTDVQEFVAKSASDSVEDWERAVEMFAGDFLEGLDIREPRFEDWRAREADRLSDVCLSVCERLMSRYLDQHRHSDAIRIASQSLRLDPFHEIAHETLVVAQAAQGRMDHARRRYEKYANLVSTELGIAPQKSLGVLLSKGQEYRPVPDGPGTDIGPGAIGTGISDTPIAIVLPFESAGKETALLADALVAKLVGELGAMLPLQVLGHSALSLSTERNISPTELAPNLGARYSVQGGIRTWGGCWRVDFRVIDVATGCQLLSSSHQLRSDTPFGACDSFAGKIAAETATVIELREQKRMLIDNAEPVDAWERCCLGMALLLQLNHDTVILAQEKFREALQIVRDQHSWDGLG